MRVVGATAAATYRELKALIVKQADQRVGQYTGYRPPLQVDRNAVSRSRSEAEKIPVGAAAVDGAGKACRGRARRRKAARPVVCRTQVRQCRRHAIRSRIVHTRFESDGLRAEQTIRFRAAGNSGNERRRCRDQFIGIILAGTDERACRRLLLRGERPGARSVRVELCIAAQNQPSVGSRNTAGTPLGIDGCEACIDVGGKKSDRAARASCTAPAGTAAAARAACSMAAGAAGTAAAAA